ncbi:alcohol oxidase [Mycena pura]|uniref:Alcohol oxidase n=1 Tax=Mycena pura TaxID=153505 RepID=A0AAD6YLN8_9AGAR|nr:alcohol oxidase [Mycena pura]
MAPTAAQVEAFASTPFDYIVEAPQVSQSRIGSLSEDPNVTVGIIEAGLEVDDDPLIDVPLNSAKNNGQPGYDWISFNSSAPQHAVLDRAIPIYRGKLLGGSSALNYMGWDRGSKEEYDAWKAVADPQGAWDWDSILPFMLKTEDRAPSSVSYDMAVEYSASAASVVTPGIRKEAAVGLGGPLKLSYGMTYGDVNPAYVKAWNALGVPTNANPWGGDASGVYSCSRTIDHETGKRVTAMTAYYKPVASRPNLKLLTGAHVTKILFKPEPAGGNHVAVGVEFSVDGKTYSAAVSKEIVVSAGVIATPQILELSGIGNRKVLESVGIPTLVDLPGDHPFTRIFYHVKPGTVTFDEFRINPEFAAAEKERYKKTGQGWMAAIDSSLCFAPLNKLMDEAVLSTKIKELEADIAKNPPSGLVAAQYAIQLDWLRHAHVPHMEFVPFCKGVINPQPDESYVMINAGLQHPFSRGSVHIQSADPFEQPKIDPAFLTHEFDAFSMLAGYRAIEKLAQTSPLADIIDKLQLPPTPLTDDAVALGYIRQVLSSGAHPMGTAALARRGLGGVVGNDLKVYGTANVRVADASIIPLPLAAHIQATVYAIGEKAADLIKKVV